MPIVIDAPRVSQPTRQVQRAVPVVVPKRRIATVLSLATLAAIICLVNCLKPLQVDDAAYALYAAHIAENPLSPYGFEVYWGFGFQPANQVLAPPVFLYWLAAARAAFGDNPLLWKLSLLPWHAVLTFALFTLLRRWTGSLSMPLTWMALLSPALLPSTNLMLDVPALALSLAAVSLFVYAADHDSWRFAVLAGLTAGLAMQTKYSGFVTPMVLLAYGLTQRKIRLAIVAAALAIMVFTTWEMFVAARHGGSHFLLAAEQRGESLMSRIRHLILPIMTLTAALSPGVLFAALLGWRQRGRWLLTSIFAAIAGFLLLGAIPAALNEWWPNPTTGRPMFRVDGALYIIWTLAWWGALAVAILQHWRNRRVPLGLISEQMPVVKSWKVLVNSNRERGLTTASLAFRPQVGSPPAPSVDEEKPQPTRHLLTFLLLWLLVEIAGSIVLSPFPAARRVLGVTVAATILIGYLMAKHRPPQSLAWTAAGASMVLGFAVALIDVREAKATEELAHAAVAIARRENPEGRTWFSGTWAFQYYAIRRGLLPIAPEYSELRAGDLLILPEQQLNRIDFRPEQAPLAKLQIIEVQDNMPWETLSCYYCGATPVRHHDGPRLRLTAYRVMADFVIRGHGTLPAVR